MNKELFQIIDANLNRTREGLRVCEDIARFAVKEKDITKSLKAIRHSATKVLLNSKRLSLRHFVRTRDVAEDPMKFIDFRKRKGTDLTNLFMSNIERVKESLRVLEECFKVLDENTSRKYRRLRFNTYKVEKEWVKKIS